MYKTRKFLNSMSETVSRTIFFYNSNNKYIILINFYNSNNKTFLSNFDIIDDLSVFHKY